MLTYMNIKYIRFYVYQGKWGTDFIFPRNNFENLKLQRIENIFICFIKLSCQSKESPLSKQSLPF